MIVLDASAALDSLDPERPEMAVAFHDLHQTGIIAPTIFISEVCQVIHRKHPKRFGAHQDERMALVETLLELVRIEPPSFEMREAAAMMVARHGLSYYDAEYLSLARLRGVPLVTHDAHLTAAAQRELGAHRCRRLDTRARGGRRAA